jgi:hypothetical protein
MCAGVESVAVVCASADAAEQISAALVSTTIRPPAQNHEGG